MLPFVYLLSFIFKNPLIAYAMTVFLLSVVSLVSSSSTLVVYILTILKMPRDKISRNHELEQTLGNKLYPRKAAKL